MARVRAFFLRSSWVLGGYSFVFGGWLLRAAPWTEAEHTVSAVNASPELARKLGVPVNAALLILERRTFQGEDVVTYARLIHPGTRHSMTERFGPEAE